MDLLCVDLDWPQSASRGFVRNAESAELLVFYWKSYAYDDYSVFEKIDHWTVKAIDVKNIFYVFIHVFYVFNVFFIFFPTFFYF